MQVVEKDGERLSMKSYCPNHERKRRAASTKSVESAIEYKVAGEMLRGVQRKRPSHPGLLSASASLLDNGASGEDAGDAKSEEETGCSRTRPWQYANARGRGQRQRIHSARRASDIRQKVPYHVGGICHHQALEIEAIRLGLPVDEVEMLATFRKDNTGGK